MSSNSSTMWTRFLSFLITLFIMLSAASALQPVSISDDTADAANIAPVSTANTSESLWRNERSIQVNDTCIIIGGKCITPKFPNLITKIVNKIQKFLPPANSSPTVKNSAKICLLAPAIAAAIAIPLIALWWPAKYKSGYSDVDYIFIPSDDYHGTGGGYGGGGGGGYGGGGYEASGGSSSYSSYAKRSLEVMSPIMNALYSAYQKYSGDDEEKPAL
ncbi:uncharacterized protein LOC108674480 [Hyalella azteca]|uniref:Uncharacterized protein LOC108674480 n=1 Tax=Hyalella azteca TaxID=294128 RepID=A0A8B7NVX5_HYAAZ|nr:uncharacterized protein LOC108674480 [Hyalella azteca]